MTDAPTWSDLFATLVDRQDLDAAQTAWAMGEIMSGEASTPKVAARSIHWRRVIVRWTHNSSM